MNKFGKGWLLGSGRGDLGRGAHATKVISFLKKCVNKTTRFWEGGLLDLGAEIWGEEPRQQQLTASLRHCTQNAHNLGGVASWIWKGKSGQRSPGNKSDEFP